MTNVETINTKTRDAATAQLRKLGIAKEFYNKFITHHEGGFSVELGAAKKFLEPPKTTKTKTAKAKRDVKLDGVTRREDTVSARARQLILEGLANKDVFAKLKEEFNLPETKKSYPAWYRSELRRQGKLPS